MSKILQYVRQNQDNILLSLERLVKAESPSNRKDLVDRCGEVLQALFLEHLGVSGETIRQEHLGNHLRFTCGEGEEQILILGHFDTVWEEGRIPYKIEDNKAYGPGIFDMKGGIIQALWAVKALKELNLPPNKRIVFFCNTDEEIGSPTSRALIEEEARKSKVVFVPEPAQSISGALKTERKGVGIFKMKVKGVSSHSGNHHDKGISAVEELAHQIVALHALTDYEKGTTVNVGVIKGGTRSNVVAEEAEAEIDFRVRTHAEAERLVRVFKSLKPKLQGTTIEVNGDLNRPPMERTEQIAALYEKARGIAAKLGFDLPEAAVGGGSDGNFTAALGIPTLDGLGCLGDGPHAEYEHVVIDSLPLRSALVAHLLLEV